MRTKRFSCSLVGLRDSNRWREGVYAKPPKLIMKVKNFIHDIRYQMKFKIMAEKVKKGKVINSIYRLRKVKKYQSKN